MENLVIKEGDNPLSDIKGDVFEIYAEIELVNAEEVGFNLRGENLVYSVAKKQLRFLETKAPLEPIENILRLTILLDRSSVEAFGNKGIVSLTHIFFPDTSNVSLGLYSKGGEIKVNYLEVNRLESIWLALNQQLGHPSPIPN
jgi:sucrose-6-phosphate hydrolase SacC (GH32 family)